MIWMAAIGYALISAIFYSYLMLTAEDDPYETALTAGQADIRLEECEERLAA
ncbi:MAG: hypothetical protein IT210_17845 [Armatimonadetes bacterium]|nr:hypothetical protein [Armatimonadota bacterium]